MEGVDGVGEDGAGGDEEGGFAGWSAAVGEAVGRGLAWIWEWVEGIA